MCSGPLSRGHLQHKWRPTCTCAYLGHSIHLVLDHLTRMDTITIPTVHVHVCIVHVTDGPHPHIHVLDQGTSFPECKKACTYTYKRSCGTTYYEKWSLPLFISLHVSAGFTFNLECTTGVSTMLVMHMHDITASLLHLYLQELAGVLSTAGSWNFYPY